MADCQSDVNVSLLEKALLDPITTIDEIFKETLKSPQIDEDKMDATTGDTADILDMEAFDDRVKSLYADIFNNPQLLNSIPYLDKEYFDSGKLKPDSIVKYRGIVQDTLNPEFFIGAYIRKCKDSGESNWEQSKYRDCISCDQDDMNGYDFDGPGVVTLERIPMILAPIPGENAWVREYYQEKYSTSSGSETDFFNSEDDTSMVIEDSSHIVNQHEMSNNSKRKIMVVDNHNCTAEVDSMIDAKKAVSEEMSNTGNIERAKNDIDDIEERKMGSHDTGGMCCLARISNFKDDDFRLNDAIEIVALYTLDVAVPLSSLGGMEDEFDEMEEPFHPSPPPPSLMPRLQILGYRRLDSSYPLINRVSLTNIQERLTENSQFTCKVHSSMVSNQQVGCVDVPLKDLSEHLFPAPCTQLGCNENIITVRSSLLSTLSAILSGQMTFTPGSRNVVPNNLVKRPDADIAAEYLLLALLSRIESRSDSGLLVGAFALNLVGLNNSTKDGSHRMTSLLSFLDSIVPKTLKIDLCIESLNNSKTLLPSRDNKTNLMCASPLMLTPGTLLMIDESKMSEGTLVDSGLKSFHALKSVVQKQIVPIEFDYYSMSMPVDNSIILFSDTSSTIFSGDGCIIRVKVDDSVDKKEQKIDTTNGKDVDLESFRKYWSCCRLLSTTMETSTAKIAEEDFVSARQHDQKISSDDFHSWLVLARLLTASYGQSMVTVNTWKQVLDLERSRKALYPNKQKSV